MELEGLGGDALDANAEPALDDARLHEAAEGSGGEEGEGEGEGAGEEGAGEDEEDAGDAANFVCCICMDDETEEDNPIILCDGGCAKGAWLRDTQLGHGPHCSTIPTMPLFFPYPHPLFFRRAPDVLWRAFSARGGLELPGVLGWRGQHSGKASDVLSVPGRRLPGHDKVHQGRRARARAVRAGGSLP